MNDNDLDQAYTALANALAQVGEDNATLFLSMLSLSLISRMDAAAPALELIANAKERCVA